MPNDGSPYPRDFIIDREGIIQYANNEIDTEWMLYVLNELLGNNDVVIGDINLDNQINILDIIFLINFILNVQIPTDIQMVASDINFDEILNILDIVQLANLVLQNN